MKRLLGIAIFAVLLSGCDDGDITSDTIEFDDVSIERCPGEISNLLFKLNGSEALILNIGTGTGAFNAAFPENPTVGVPASFPIGTANFVAYQMFNGEVPAAMFCSAIPPINPDAVDAWNATGGAIEITTTAETINNLEEGFEGGTKIDRYSHNIIFKNIEFLLSNGTSQLYPEFNFGTYERNIQIALPRVFNEDLNICGDEETIYNISGNHAMVLKIDETLLDTLILNTPKTGTVNADTNKFTYSIYEASVDSDTQLCTANPVTDPIQTWQGTGHITVTTTDGGAAGTFLHTIRVQNIVLRRNNAEFILAADYLFGMLLN